MKGLQRILQGIDRFVPDAVRERGADALRRSRLAVAGAWTAALLYLAAAVLHQLAGAGPLARVALLMALLLAALPLALRATGSGALVRHALPLLLLGYALLLSLASGGKAVGPLFAAAAVPLVAVLLGGVRPGLAWSALACAALLAMAGIDRLDAELPLETRMAVQTPDRFRIVLLFTLGSSALVLAYEALLQRAWADLSAEQERVEAAHRVQRESERRFRLLTEEASDIITEWDATGFIHYVSPQVERITGIRPEELIHTHWLEHVERVHPDDTEGFGQALEQVVQGNTQAQVAMRLRHDDGSWRWLEFGMRAYRNAVGELRVVSIGRDVTARREVEALRGARPGPGAAES